MWEAEVVGTLKCSMTYPMLPSPPLLPLTTFAPPGQRAQVWELWRKGGCKWTMLGGYNMPQLTPLAPSSPPGSKPPGETFTTWYFLHVAKINKILIMSKQSNYHVVLYVKLQVWSSGTVLTKGHDWSKTQGHIRSLWIMFQQQPRNEKWPRVWIAAFIQIFAHIGHYYLKCTFCNGIFL